MTNYKMSQHAEWMRLVEVAGSFIAVSVLERVFPQGLDPVSSTVRMTLKSAYEEWRDIKNNKDRQVMLFQNAWIELVLSQLLEYKESDIIDYDKSRAEWEVESDDFRVKYLPDLVIKLPTDEKPRMFVSICQPNTRFELPYHMDGWPVSDIDRMILLCKKYGVRIGLITNGDKWTIINASDNSATGNVTWYSSIWFQEHITLKAFRSLLGARRCFGHPDDSLNKMLEESLEVSSEVTDTLGKQVSHSIEVLIRCIDRIDQDNNRMLLENVKPEELYEAALTVMMRLVFILCAEERGLLLSGDLIYDENYSVAHLRSQLAEEAEINGTEVLDRRYDAWARLLAIFRGIYGGVEHEDLKMPAFGGTLFDPDRFPFLEGRKKETNWKDSLSDPLPVDNRTVLLLLNSLQILEQPGGAIYLSFRALDVEQIGHVYEGLLEHTVSKVQDDTVQLICSSNAKKTMYSVVDLEKEKVKDESKLVAFLTENTGRSEAAIKNALVKQPDDETKSRILFSCGGDLQLAQRILPFSNLINNDAWGEFIIYRKGSYAVHFGKDRRESGSHYTPKSLSEKVVNTTLEPLLFTGPSAGLNRRDWKLISSDQIQNLKICDPAMGSGAFLVQTCRYLSEKLVEAWEQEELTGKRISIDGKVIDELEDMEPMPKSLNDRLTIAKRIVAERCLFGIDINPLAVELAKLSIWLITLSKNQPFTFLDHNFKSGDSLLGINKIEQLISLNMNIEVGQYHYLSSEKIDLLIKDLAEVRKKIREMPIHDLNDIKLMEDLNYKSQQKCLTMKICADAFIGEVYKNCDNANKLNNSILSLSIKFSRLFAGETHIEKELYDQARESLSIDGQMKIPFHWAVEFPEVFSDEKCGFDAIVGNPPFMGGQKISGTLGEKYRKYIVKFIGGGQKGSADLVAYFLLRARDLIKSKAYFGLIATNSIAEGDTRDVGLKRLCADGDLFTAIKSEKWPGKANVSTSRIHFYLGKWLGHKILDGNEVSFISENISNRDNWKPVKIKENLQMCFQGSIILGLGFTLGPSDVVKILDSFPDYECKVLFPYLSGKEVNSLPNPYPKRWVISFWDWSEEEAIKYDLLYNIVKEKVKPERDKLRDNPTAAQRKKYWWRYGRDARHLYESIGRGKCFNKKVRIINKISRVLVFATGATKYPCFTFVPNKYIYANSLCVIASDSYSIFACLSSDIHTIWAWEYGSKMREDLRYSHGDIFETFPFPEGILEGTNKILEEVGEQLYSKRQDFMIKNKKGMTAFYNDFHDRKKKNQELEEIRKIQHKLNLKVLQAYGFEGLELDYDYHEVGYLPVGKNKRLTISEENREDLLYRLCELNKRYSGEQRKK